MIDKTQANIGFEKQLWDAACVLWGHIPAAEYRKVIITPASVEKTLVSILKPFDICCVFLFLERNTNLTGNNLGRWFVERKVA